MRNTKWWKRLAAAAMSAVLLVPGQAVYAGNGNESVYAGQSGGIHTLAADLTISTVEELQNFARSVNEGNSYEGKTVRLAQDIQITGNAVNNFTPIGSGSHPFMGTFDGCGYTVSGLNAAANSDRKYIGLFGCVESSGIVKNVTVKDSQFSGSSIDNNCVGSIVGDNRGMVDNCHNRNSRVTDGCEVGGIAGYTNGTVINCSSTGEVIGTVYNHKSGGIVGHAYEGVIQNCCNTGKVQCTTGGSDSYSFAQ